MIFSKKSKLRKSSTGGIYQINDHLFEGCNTPTNTQGKREGYTIYAPTREEVETLLKKIIVEVRKRIKKTAKTNDSLGDLTLKQHGGHYILRVDLLMSSSPSALVVQQRSERC